jgi:hypothetical protein
MEGIYVGHEEGVKGYMIYKPRTRKVLTFRDARFEEEKTYYERTSPKAPTEADLCIPQAEDTPQAARPPSEINDPQEDDEEEVMEEVDSQSSAIEDENEEGPPLVHPQEQPALNEDFPQEEEKRSQEAPLKRYYRAFKLPPGMREEVEASEAKEKEGAKENIVEAPKVPRRSPRLNPELFEEPQSKYAVDISYEDAMMSEEAHKWQVAMEEEISTFKELNVYSLVPLPEGKKAVKSKWVYEIKDGGKRYKGRLVAQGCTMEYFGDTFSPVVSKTTIRTVLTVAAHRDMEVHQMDVKCAYLYADLDEEVYLTQPKGFVDPEHPEHVWRLHKAVYGLKQSAKCWFGKLRDTLLKLGFAQSRADSSLFVRKTGDN